MYICDNSFKSFIRYLSKSRRIKEKWKINFKNLDIVVMKGKLIILYFSTFKFFIFYITNAYFRPDQENICWNQVSALVLLRFLESSTNSLQQNDIDSDKKVFMEIVFKIVKKIETFQYSQYLNKWWMEPQTNLNKGYFSWEQVWNM